MRQGPKLSISRSCQGCEHELSKSYAVQGDSGHSVSCTLVGRAIGDTTWSTPDWCPYLKAPPRRERLQSAIRAYTVDAKDAAGEPAANGPAEEASGDLAAAIIDASIALRARGQHVTASRLLKAAERDAELEADRIRDLREAADAFFAEEHGK